MSRSGWQIAAVAAALVCCAGPERIAMTQSIQLELAPAPNPASGRLNSIRLLAHEGGAALAALADAGDGSRPLTLTPIGEGLTLAPPQRLFDLESPFGAPSWDAVSTATGIVAVWTRPGSAIVPLVSRRATGGEVVLTKRYPMGVFEHPRFVRGEGGRALTAVTERDGEKVLVLFRDGQDEYVTLPTVGGGRLIDGLLVRQASSYLLFARLLPPGSRGADRTDLRGESIEPGVLVCSRLGADLKPSGDDERPFADVRVFEFDADATADRAVVFATTDRGHVMSEATMDGASLRWRRAPDPQQREDLVAPSVLAQNATVIGAALRPSEPPSVAIGRYDR